MDREPGVTYIFTDGSAKISKAGVYSGGWAVLMIHGEKRKTLSGGAVGPHATVNRMELTAILEGLKAVNPLADYPVRLYSDSSYSVSAILGGKELVKNMDLIKACRAARLPNVSIGWIKGHAATEENHWVDRMAHEARLRAEAVPKPIFDPVVVYGPLLAEAIAKSKEKAAALMPPIPRKRTRTHG